MVPKVAAQKHNRRFRTVLLAMGCLGLLLVCNGCGSFIANRLVQAPNSYPDWFAPDAPVTLGFSAGFLTNFPPHYAEVGEPKAKLRYRIIEPADYHFRTTHSNWLDHGRAKYNFTFHADLPAKTNQWSQSPRGTVVLLHGYALAQFSMAPWAIRLGEEGWRCVLVDLRGHGKSSGKKIYYGIRETNDLSELLDVLARGHQLAESVAVMGESYGGALALRWAGVEPRVKSVVSIAPFVVLSNAVMNIRAEYVSWFPPPLLRLGIEKLPKAVGVEAGALDTTTVMQQHPVKALFIAGDKDTIMPQHDLEQLTKLASEGSRLVVVPGATHESLTYFFDDLDKPVSEWLDRVP